MYRVIHEPDYDESVEIGKTETPQEAIEMIYFYCSKHHYTPNIFHWSKMDDPSCEVVDVSTGHDIFLIINEDGGAVKLEPVIETTYCSAADCSAKDCPLHPINANEDSKFSDLTNWCTTYQNQWFRDMSLKPPQHEEEKEDVYNFNEVEGGFIVACVIPVILMILADIGIIIKSIVSHNPNWLSLIFITFLLCNLVIGIFGWIIGKKRGE